LIVINIFCSWINHLGWMGKKDNIVLEGPPRRLSGPEIIDMLDNLVLKKNKDEFVGYEKEYN
jgi:hypothetical protein